MMNAFFPAAKELGPNAQFRGGFEWLQDSQAWNASVTGRVEDVSWGQLTSTLPHELAGRGHIDLQQALVVDGRIVQMKGTLSAQDGRISRDWLNLSQEWLGLGVDPDVLRSSVETVSFEAMRVGFQLDGQGLFLQGGIPASNPNYAASVLADSRDGLVYVRDAAMAVSVERLIHWITATQPAASVHPIQTVSITSR